MTRPFEHAVIMITSKCDGKCPHCCCRVADGGLGKPRVFSVAGLAKAVEYLRGLKSICISGGEPGLHPDLPQIAAEFRVLFKPERFNLATNGEAVVRYPESMRHFDEVRVTAFDTDRARKAAVWMREHEPARFRPQSSVHTPTPTKDRGQPCSREAIAAWFNGKLYRCCVAPGQPGAVGVDPMKTKDWEAAYTRLPLPCTRCPFSPEG